MSDKSIEQISDELFGNPEPEQKHYGFWQVCPKCDGEGVVPGNYPAASNNYAIDRTCPVCNGVKLLVRPEIKKEGPGE